MVLRFDIIIIITLFTFHSSFAQKEQKSFSFVQMCDTQLGMGGYEHDVKSFRQAVKQINELNPDFVTICGDLVHNATDTSYADFLKIKSAFKMPCYAASGNHDVGNVPNDSTLNYYRKTVGDDYYTFQNKGFSFIVTNTQLWKVNVENESEKHDKWFKNTITKEGKKGQPVFVIGHYPIFLKTPDEEEVYFNLPIKRRKEILTLFKENNVKAYLSGHKHELIVNNYENIQFVSGEATSKNFDGRPLGFRLWEVSSDTIKHQLVPLRTSFDPKAIKLMSYNVKFASPTFEPSWEVRREMQVDMIRKYSPDIIGTQEGLKEQVDFLMDSLPEYVVIGEGRKGGDDDEHMAIFFKRDKFRLREMGSFQLSKAPNVIGSGPSVNPRMVTWARLAIIKRASGEEKDRHPMDYRGHWKNTQEFYVFNTHFFDRRDQKMARVNAAKLIMKRISELNRFGEWTKERPIFLMGDFNSQPGGEVYKTFIGDENSDGGDFLEDSLKGGDGIDWIMSRGNVKVLYYENVDYNVDRVYPSDHTPIYVEYKILENKVD